MVTLVDSSLNLLSSRPATQDLGLAANGATAGADGGQAGQIGAATSPAWLRGTSVATDAWISSTHATDTESDVKGVGESKPAADLGTATAASSMRSKKLSIASEDMLIDAIITFNQTLQKLPALQQQLQGFQASLGAATDDRMVTYLNQMIASTISAISQANAVVANGPGAIEDGLAEIKRSRGVTGTIYTRNPDGSFSFGQFSIHVQVPNGAKMVSWSHDGSGTAVKNVYGENGTQSTEVKLA